MKRSLAVPVDTVDESVIQTVMSASAAGFERVWTTERAGRDPFTQSAMFAARVPRVALGTGIAYAFTRHPMAIAGAAVQLQRWSTTPVAIGLGSGTRGIRDWYGVPLRSPARYLADYARALRAIFEDRDETDFSYDSDNHHLRFPAHEMSALRRSVQSLSTRPSFYGSGLNPVMIREAAGACDGLVLHPLALAPKYLRDTALPAIAAGAERQHTAPHLTAFCITAVARETPEARHLARRQLAFYFTTPSYQSVAIGTPWEDAAAVIRERFKAGLRDWSSLSRLIPPTMLEDLCLSGTPADIESQYARLEARLVAAGFSEVVLVPVSVLGGDENVTEQLRLLADVFPRPTGRNSTPNPGGPADPNNILREQMTDP